MILCIINRLGTVHADRDGHTCPAAATAPRRKGVTPLQIHVYHLGPCSSCFPMRAAFDRAIEGSTDDAVTVVTAVAARRMGVA